MIMLKIVDFTLTKYKHGTTPNDGEIAWRYITTNDEAQNKRKAIARLCKYLEQKDPNRYEYYDGDFVELVKMRRDSDFNDSGDVIYKKAIGGDAKFHRKAIQRLARYLSKRDGEYIYFGRLPLLSRGENCYILHLRDTVVLSEYDIRKRHKNQLRGKKAAITKSINKAKKIRDKYKSSLMLDGYRSDPRFVSLVSNLWKQKQRYVQQKHSQPDYTDNTNGIDDATKQRFIGERVIFIEDHTGFVETIRVQRRTLERRLSREYSESSIYFLLNYVYHNIQMDHEELREEVSLSEEDVTLGDVINTIHTIDFVKKKIYNTVSLKIARPYPPNTQERRISC